MTDPSDYQSTAWHTAEQLRGHASQAMRDVAGWGLPYLIGALNDEEKWTEAKITDVMAGASFLAEQVREDTKKVAIEMVRTLG